MDFTYSLFTALAFLWVIWGFWMGGREGDTKIIIGLLCALCAVSQMDYLFR